jgi:hypothetical protein
VEAVLDGSVDLLATTTRAPEGDLGSNGAKRKRAWTTEARTRSRGGGTWRGEGEERDGGRSEKRRRRRDKGSKEKGPFSTGSLVFYSSETHTAIPWQQKKRRAKTEILVEVLDREPEL